MRGHYSARLQKAVLRMLGREQGEMAPGKQKTTSMVEPNKVPFRPSSTTKPRKQKQSDEEGDVKAATERTDCGKELEQMSVAALRAELRQRGQRVGGRKEELVQRLKELRAPERPVQGNEHVHYDGRESDAETEEAPGHQDDSEHKAKKSRRTLDIP